MRQTDTWDYGWLPKLERIRAEDNGVEAIRLYMGANGHFTCQFHKANNTQICKGESRKSLIQAVECCINNFVEIQETVGVQVLREAITSGSQSQGS